MTSPSTTQHHPRKKFFNRLQAIITSPKRALGHAERDGIGFGRIRRESCSSSITNSTSPGHQEHTETVTGDDGDDDDDQGESHEEGRDGEGEGHHRISLSSHQRHLRDDPGSPARPLWMSRPDAIVQRRRTSPSAIRPPAPQHNNNASAQPHPLDVNNGVEEQQEGHSSQYGGATPEPEKPKVLIRPHLKIRIVTWNMHDSLPTGDLTELLGHPPSADKVEVTAPPEALDPEHPVPVLSSGLEKHSPYHIIVVGGQEVPVGYGGWAGPNWTEIIQTWLSEAANFAPPTQPPTHLQQQQQQAQQVAPNDAGTSKDVRPGTKPPPLATKSITSDLLPEQALTLSPVEDAPEEDDDLPTPHKTDFNDNEKEILSSAVFNIHPPSSARKQDPDLTSPQPTHLPQQSNPPPPLHNHYSQANASSASLRSNSNQGHHSATPTISTSAMGKRNMSADSSITASSAASAATSTHANANANASPNVTSKDSEGVTGITDGKERQNSQGSLSPYVLVAKERLMGIYCSVWVYKECQDLIRASSTGTVTAGLLAGKLGNKGAACISLLIANTRLLFVCAHLAAHSEKSNVRQQNVKKIKEELVIDTFGRVADKALDDKAQETEQKEAEDVIHDAEMVGKDKAAELRKRLRGKDADKIEDITDLFDYTFWFGDLNFRLDISRLHADFLIKEKQYSTALSFDQLGPILKDSNGCFKGFTEGDITFAPSYKYDVLKLKRSMKLQRRDTNAGIERSMSMSKTADGKGAKHMSLAASSSVATSHATFPEEDEETFDRPAFQTDDRMTLGSSSRASISSAFSGFEAYDDDGNPIERSPYVNNNAGFFGSVPGTPAAEKVMDKAKNLFHLVRNRSTTQIPQSISQERAGSPSLHQHPPQNVRNRTTSNNSRSLPPPILIPGASSNSYDSQLLSPIDLSAVGGLSYPQSVVPERRISFDGQSGPQPAHVRATTPISSANVPFGSSVTSSTPSTTSRPRLTSSKSSATILSVAESKKAEHEKQVENDAVFDSSSKKRVQSWTDRILFKTTIAPPKPAEEEGEEHSNLRHLGSGILDSLRGVRRNFTTSHVSSTSNVVTLNHPRPLIRRSSGNISSSQRVTFSPSAQDNEQGKLSRNDSTLPTFSRRNTSQSSLTLHAPQSQQPLNQRLLRLFGRNKESTSPQPSPELNAESTRRASSASLLRLPMDKALSDDTRASNGTSPPKLNRASSSASGKLRRRLSDQVRRTSLHPRRRPGRSNTAPAPLSPITVAPALSSLDEAVSTPLPSAVSHSTTFKPSGTSPTTIAPHIPFGAEISPAVTITAAPADHESRQTHAKENGLALSLGIPPAVDGISQQPRETATTSLITETSPSPHRRSLEGDPTPSSRLDALDHEGKRSFSFPNPFSAGNAHAGKGTPASGLSALVAKARSAQNDAGLPRSKTTPVSPTQGYEHEGQSHHTFGLRQWWNAHVTLPFLAHMTDPSHDPEEAVDTRDVNLYEVEPSPPEPPKPVLLGPQRGEIQCIDYDSIADLRRMQACSDHRPVVAVFALGV